MSGGLKIRMRFESIIGQERPIRFLTQMLRKRNIPHAMLFTGIDGIGKQTTARALGMALNCLSPVGVSACGECPSCQKVTSGTHPDMITVKPGGAFIKIDQVRAVSRQLRFAPLEGDWRVIIINDAHALNLEASNAILKILEEPPKGTVIILTASQTTDLLPTIVSRCQQLAFRPIPYEKVAEVLVELKGLDRQTATTLAVSTKGSLGKTVSVDGEKWTIWRTRLLEQIASLSIRSIQPIFAFADALARDKDRLADALDMIMTWFRDALMCNVSPDRIINKDFTTKIQHASHGRSVNELLEKVEAVCAAQIAILQNSNPRLALEVMMMRLFR
jgi:DNA polymerase-3 subunit delta'